MQCCGAHELALCYGLIKNLSAIFIFLFFYKGFTAQVLKVYRHHVEYV